MKTLIQEVGSWITSAGSTDKVLLIDDSRSDRHYYSRLVRGSYQVITASGGREGLEMAETHSPDVILLDYMMPEMLGTEVCEKLKENPLTKNIPIIFLTSFDTPDTVIKALEFGADAYLVKPVSRADLIMQISFSLKMAREKN